MRLLVLAFLAIATAISVNALYFQVPPHIAAATGEAGGPKTASEGPANAAAKTAVKAADARAVEAKSGPLTTASLPANHAAAPAGPQPTPLVRSIQKKLAEFGYKSLPQNGILGHETRAAILAAEFEQGLPLTGEPAERVLSALYFLEAAGRTRLASIERFEQDRRLVAEVEDLLAKFGYGGGVVDGQIDARTREAIRRFEADRKLKPDGRLTERILLELLIEKGQPLLTKG